MTMMTVATGGSLFCWAVAVFLTQKHRKQAQRDIWFFTASFCFVVIFVCQAINMVILFKAYAIIK